MAGYTPLFSDIYMGTLYGRWPAAAVWATLLPLMDKHGHIDMSMQAIAGMTGWPVDLLETGIRQLMEPDSHSRTSGREGRRLVLIDEDRPWGWQVVNHQKYREKARLMAKNAREAKPQKPPETAGNAESAPQTQTQTHTQTKTHKDMAPDGALDALKAVYPKRGGQQRWQRARNAIRARFREGHTLNEIVEGAKRYAAYCERTEKVGTEYVMQASTFVGTDKPFLEPWEPPAEKTPRKTRYEEVMEQNQ